MPGAVQAMSACWSPNWSAQAGRWSAWTAPPRCSKQPASGRRRPDTAIAAGFPAPRLRMVVPLGGGPDFPGYDMFAGIIRTLLPVLEREGLLTAAEAEVETLAARLRAEVVAGGGVLAAPPAVGAWAVKPADP